jgi:hypothetical protein
MHKMKVMFHKTGNFFILFLLVLVFCITACKPSSSKTSSITNNVCSPPCWQNITPGETTREDAIKLLTNLSDIKKSSIESTSTVEPNDSIKWIWNSKADDYSGRIFFQGDVTALIAVTPKEKKLQFKDIIYGFGEPERVLAFRTKGEQAIITIYVLYPSKGYGFMDYYISDSRNTERTVEVKPEEEVKYVWLGEVKTFYQNLTNGKIDRLPNNIVNENTQIWNGYVQYKYFER